MLLACVSPQDHPRHPTGLNRHTLAVSLAIVAASGVKFLLRRRAGGVFRVVSSTDDGYDGSGAIEEPKEGVLREESAFLGVVLDAFAWGYTWPGGEV